MRASPACDEAPLAVFADHYVTGGPIGSCSPCSNYDPQCQTCTSSACTSCASGVSGQCSAVWEMLLYTCALRCAHFAHCPFCFSGYFRVGNACNACSTALGNNCLTCSSATQCTSCKPGEACLSAAGLGLCLDSWGAARPALMRPHRRHYPGTENVQDSSSAMAPASLAAQPSPTPQPAATGRPPLLVRPARSSATALAPHAAPSTPSASVALTARLAPNVTEVSPSAVAQSQARPPRPQRACIAAVTAGLWPSVHLQAQEPKGAPPFLPAA